MDQSAMNPDLTAIVGFQAIDAPEDGRFARAGRPNDANHLTRLYLHVDATQDMVVAKTFVNAAELDHDRFTLRSAQLTQRIKGTLRHKYSNATKVKTVPFLKVEAAIICPFRANSATVMVDA